MDGILKCLTNLTDTRVMLLKKSNSNITVEGALDRGIPDEAGEKFAVAGIFFHVKNVQQIKLVNGQIPSITVEV